MAFGALISMIIGLASILLTVYVEFAVDNYIGTAFAYFLHGLIG